jgi:hypothetical protein
MIGRRPRLAASAVVLLGLAVPLMTGPAAMADEATDAAPTSSPETTDAAGSDAEAPAPAPDETSAAATEAATSSEAPASVPETDAEAPAPDPGAQPAEAGTSIEVSGVSFEWGINNESSGGSYFGGCNFLSAGVAGDAGSSRVWTQADGFYSASEGNTTIVKPTANDGSGEQSPTWASRCLLPDGGRLVQPTSSGSLSYTQSKVRIVDGSGTLDPEADDAEIQWRGSFTVAYYGGMTYWSVTDPKLTVDDGVGTLTALVTGYGADMDDPTVWSKLPDQPGLTLATLSGVDVREDGITVTPDYLGVGIPDEVKGRNPQATKTAENAGYWGAFPADFLTYQLLTGQSSYWYTTDGGPNTLQPRKATLPLRIGFDSGTGPQPQRPLEITAQPADASVSSRQPALFEVTAAGGAGETVVVWQRDTGDGSWADLDDAGDGVSGSATSTLTIPEVTTALSGSSYRAIVRSGSGDDAEEVVSASAVLTVTPKVPGSRAPFADMPALDAALTAGEALDRTSAAGMPSTIRTGDDLTVRLPWTSPVHTGADVTAEVWLYPQREFLGEFTVVDGAVLFGHTVGDGETGANALVFAVDGQRATVVRYQVAQPKVELTDAQFDWGINNESNGGSYFGGCNFLSAGVAGDAGSSRVWTQADGLYRTQDGNTSIVRPTADGSALTAPTWSTKCQTPSGTSINGKATNAADSYSQTRVRISGGRGTLDPATGTAEIQWQGSFTVAYYGGMTYWSASDPKLVVRADGTGTVTATVGGYGADMDDASKWNTLRTRTVTLANLSGVTVTAAGITATPDYLGVSIPADIAGRNAQAAQSAENQAWWGAFPADFLRFQLDTGQSSYWYTTPGGSGTIQPRKVPLPLTVCTTADCTVSAQGGTGTTTAASVTQNNRKPPVKAPRPAAQAFAVAASDAATVVIVKRPAAAIALPVDDELVLVAAAALIAALGLLALVGAAGGVLFATGAIRPDLLSAAPPT